MNMPARWEGRVKLGHTSLTVHLRGTATTIDGMGVDATQAEGTAPPDDVRWMDVLEALAAWGTRRGPRDWTAHPAFPHRGTAFQRLVWQALCDIAPGETAGYGELARRIGHPRAARAIGQAVGANPWAPLVPCHRVVAGDGSLGGYSGGLETKRRLLALEGVEID